MKRLTISIVVCLLFLGAKVASAQSGTSVPVCGLHNDATAHIPANYNTFTAPPIGGSYVDALTGCTVTRISNDGVDSIYYASLTPFSADAKYILIVNNTGSIDIRTAPAYQPTYTSGTIVVPAANMPGGAYGNSKWDLTNPLKFYYVSGNSIMSATLTGLPSCISGHSCTATPATVHQFTEYNSIAFDDESDISQDGTSLNFTGFSSSGSGPMAIAMWNMVTSTKTVLYTTSCTSSNSGSQPGCLHKMQVTPDNGVVVTFTANGTAAEQGTWYFPGNGGSGVNIQNATNHMDTGLTKSGGLVFIQNRLDSSKGNDPCPSGGGTDLSGLTAPTTGTCILDTNWASTHIAYRGSSSQPWVVESFFDTRSPGPEFFTTNGNYVTPTTTQSSTVGGTGWYPYEGEVIMYPVDNANGYTSLYRLAQGRSRSMENFWAQDTPSPSHDAKYVAFTSNMAYPSGACSSPSTSGCSDVYVISGPSGGPLFGSTSSSSAPVPPTNLIATAQ